MDCGGGPYGQQVTRGQDLTGKDFSGQTLIKQDFKTSIPRQANFRGAKLLGTSFFDADLTGADLSDADLRNADFSLANVMKEEPGEKGGVHPGADSGGVKTHRRGGSFRSLGLEEVRPEANQGLSPSTI